MATPLIRQRMTPRAAQWRIFAMRPGGTAPAYLCFVSECA
jgi:hypothetical protein